MSKPQRPVFFEDEIAGKPATIISGDILKIQEHINAITEKEPEKKVAVIVAHYFDSASPYGLAGDIKQMKGNDKFFKPYEDHIKQNGPMEPGSIFIINDEAAKKNEPQVYICVATVDADRLHNFNTVYTAKLNANKYAGENDLILASPALGTGGASFLLTTQSAEAQYSADHDYIQSGGKDVQTYYCLLTKAKGLDKLKDEPTYAPENKPIDNNPMYDGFMTSILDRRYIGKHHEVALGQELTPEHFIAVGEVRPSVNPNKGKFNFPE